MELLGTRGARLAGTLGTSGVSLLKEVVLGRFWLERVEMVRTLLAGAIGL